VLKQGELDFWPGANPEALEQGRVTFMPHTLFAPNPVKDADVYWLRSILHAWDDDNCVKILAAVKAGMSPKSRIILCEYIMNTTIGQQGLESAPDPLPANWGYYNRFSHNMDLCCMTSVKGRERTPEQFVRVIEAAGLRVLKMWPVRSHQGLIEVVLPGPSLA
jgi:hypothetical protein